MKLFLTALLLFIAAAASVLIFQKVLLRSGDHTIWFSGRSDGDRAGDLIWYRDGHVWGRGHDNRRDSTNDCYPFPKGIANPSPETIYQFDGKEWHEVWRQSVPCQSDKELRNK